ncbi:MAG: hypothetical protein HKP61_21000 [Dactylosporangium sp.]|nr:hypothetical protein [Dactylosporangium sp.]NNJ63359.1 hypothetical protein [Dactylosporangium sp.]
MADGCDSTLTLDRPGPATLVETLTSFVGDHDGAKAVIEYLGRRRVRIALTGSDGVCAEHSAPGTDVARTACAKAGVVVENSWERELFAQMRPSNDLWRALGRRVLSR